MVSDPTAGWVYILTNPGLPGVVKIGLTTRDTRTRSSELLNEYGTVYPFALASRHAVSDCVAVEAAAHRLLDACRLPASELFRCDVATAQKAVLSASADLLCDVLTAPWWLRLRRRYWFRITRLRARPAYHPYRRRKRHSHDGLLIIILCIGLAAPIVVFKPALPSWLPGSVLRVAVLLEHLRR